MGLGKDGGGNDLRKLIKPVAPPKEKSGIDAGFAALALGVVALSAGGAMVAPSVFSWMGSVASPVRPIEKVVAGLDHAAVKVALAKEAFPDEHGRKFMKLLAAEFPSDHEDLLNRLANTAVKPGADRTDLVMEMNQWSVGFTLDNLTAIGRTGAKGFDKTLGLVSETLGAVEDVVGGCDLKAFENFVGNPENLLAAGEYDSKLYRFGMKASTSLLELMVEGRDKPPGAAAILPKDERALQAAFISMVRDPQIMSLIETGTRGNLPPEEAAAKINVCQLGRTIVVKLKNLPTDTKERIWSVGAIELKRAMANGGLNAIMNQQQMTRRQMSMR
jgi:hypothetical protein